MSRGRRPSQPPQAERVTVVVSEDLSLARQNLVRGLATCERSRGAPTRVRVLTKRILARLDEQVKCGLAVLGFESRFSFWCRPHAHEV